MDSAHPGLEVGTKPVYYPVRVQNASTVRVPVYKIRDTLSFERYLGHAGAGCVSAMAGGGKCGSGAMAAFAGKWVTNKTVDLENRFAQFTAATISSGTVSVIGGGKFSNGAVTGAMGYLYNCGLTKCWDKYLYYGSKTVLGIAGALGSASAGPMGAPALAFSLSTVYEGASGVANTVNDAPNKGGENPMVDAVKSVAARGGMSPAAQSLVANGVQVAADVAALRAPVRFVERWVISPSAAMTPGLVITTNAWNSGNKAVSSANVILDGSGM